MTYEELLTEKGIEYILTNGAPSPVEKIRVIETINHIDFVPATYDELGNLLTEEVLEHDEVVLTNETYIEPLPLYEDLLIEKYEISSLISFYLKDNDSLIDKENDYLNVVENKIHTWSFKNLNAPSNAELLTYVNRMNVQEKLIALEKSGKADEEICRKCIHVIGGYNKQRSLPLAKINQMISTFSNIDYALNKNMPKLAKNLIASMEVDGEIITEELKTLLLEVLK